MCLKVVTTGVLSWRVNGTETTGDKAQLTAEENSSNKSFSIQNRFQSGTGPPPLPVVCILGSSVQDIANPITTFVLYGFQVGLQFASGQRTL